MDDDEVVEGQLFVAVDDGGDATWKVIDVLGRTVIAERQDAYERQVFSRAFVRDRRVETDPNEGDDLYSLYSG